MIFLSARAGKPVTHMRSQQQQTTTIQSIPDVQNQEYLNRLCHSREEMGNHQNFCFMRL